MNTEDAIAELYEELRRRARRLVRLHRTSMDATSLVHETVAKLWQADPARWESSVHLRATASLAMRQILIDRARRTKTGKHGRDAVRVTLDDVARHDEGFELVVLADAITALEEAHPRCGTVVVCRVLGGMGQDEIATWLGVSASSVKRDWRVGRAWLKSALDA